MACPVTTKAALAPVRSQNRSRRDGLLQFTGACFATHIPEYLITPVRFNAVTAINTNTTIKEVLKTLLPQRGNSRRLPRKQLTYDPEPKANTMHEFSWNQIPGHQYTIPDGPTNHTCQGFAFGPAHSTFKVRWHETKDFTTTPTHLEYIPPKPSTWDT